MQIIPNPLINKGVRHPPKIKLPGTDQTDIRSLTHPKYEEMRPDWEKFRDVAVSGHDFVEKYTKMLSYREDALDYANRKDLTYCPAHAKAAVLDIKNAIYQRMADIRRLDGPTSYQDALINGVDTDGNTMNGFIGRKIIYELLTMGKVGTFIDRPDLGPFPSSLQTTTNQPYLYTYTAENILNWAFDTNNQLINLLLRDAHYTIDEETGLTLDMEDRYRHLRLHKGKGVTLDYYGADGLMLASQHIDLPIIPFVIFEISQSLLTDIADYQIALLNLASSDMSYAVRSNFPFFTEQFNPSAAQSFVRPSGENADGTEDTSKYADSENADVGPMHGRKYPIGVERPSFIHPSAEPLRASMEKQEKLKTDIRQLVNLNLETLEPRRASAESKQEDKATKEEGLSYIGLELQYGEQQIARAWAAYEGASEPVIMYPSNYSLKSDVDRRVEGKELSEFAQIIPSISYQREILKEVATITVGHRVQDTELSAIHGEIDSQNVVVFDPATLVEDHKEGIVSAATAAVLRGYPEGEAERAQEEHAERLKRIMESQQAARGVSDGSAEPNAEAREEKLTEGKGPKDDR